MSGSELYDRLRARLAAGEPVTPAFPPALRCEPRRPAGLNLARAGSLGPPWLVLIGPTFSRYGLGPRPSSLSAGEGLNLSASLINFMSSG